MSTESTAPGHGGNAPAEAPAEIRGAGPATEHPLGAPGTLSHLM